MASKFAKALANKTLGDTKNKAKTETNVAKIENISISLLDENPDNETVFNMDEIEKLERSITDNGFMGVVEVFKKPDGRYEISSGHRRVRAVKELIAEGKRSSDTVPCIVNTMPSDVVRAKKLLDSNITNREMKPLDWARSIEYYINNVLIPSGITGKFNQKCSEYFGISTSSVYKYRVLLDMIEPLQELADDPRFSYSAFNAVHKLSKAGQQKLYTILKEKLASESDSEDATISRTFIEENVRELLKYEGSYQESRNKDIAEKAEKNRKERQKAETEAQKSESNETDTENINEADNLTDEKLIHREIDSNDKPTSNENEPKAADEIENISDTDNETVNVKIADIKKLKDYLISMADDITLDFNDNSLKEKLISLRETVDQMIQKLS